MRMEKKTRPKKEMERIIDCSDGKKKKKNKGVVEDQVSTLEETYKIYSNMDGFVRNSMELELKDHIGEIEPNVIDKTKLTMKVESVYLKDSTSLISTET